MARMRTTLLAVVWLILRALPLPAQVPPELKTAHLLALSVEASEWSSGPGPEFDLPLGVVEAALEQVEKYLARRPQDPSARVLGVRLGRIRDGVVFRIEAFRTRVDSSPPARDAPSHAGYLDVLDDIIARYPSHADARYWRARLTLEEDARPLESGGPPYSSSRAGPEAVQRALDLARTSVSLDPWSPAKREFLGYVLALAQQFDEAAAALDHPSTRGSLMDLLVQDLAAFAPPAGAARDRMLAGLGWQTWWMATGGGGNRAVLGLRAVRVGAWSMPGSLDDLRDHYQARWPDARFPPWEWDVASRFVYSGGDWRVEERRPPGAPEPYRPEAVVVVVLMAPESYRQYAALHLAEGLPPELVPPGERVGILYLNLRRDPALVTLSVAAWSRAAHVLFPARGHGAGLGSNLNKGGAP